MRAKPDTISGLIHTGLDILTTTVNAKTRRILVQTGDVTKEATDTDGAEWWQHVGFASRPPKPEAGKQAAQAVVCKTSDHDIVIASVDQRGLDLYGNLDHGETCLYAAGDDGKGQARALLKKDGSVSLYTRQGNTEDGVGMLVQLDAMNNAVRFLNASGFGVIVDENGVTLTTGAASLTLGADGSVKLVGKAQTQVDGGSIVIGSVAIAGVNSALTGVTGVAGKASLKTVIE